MGGRRRAECRSAWQIRQLWKIRRSLSVENAKTLVHALVASRIDFCNRIFYRVAAVHLRELQSVLSAAARLVLKLRKFDRVSISTTIRNQLHWLPVHKRIMYKLCVLVFKCQHEQAPTHLSSLVRRSQLSQPVVRRGQQPKATSNTRKQELSNTVHMHLQFLDLHVGTYFRHL